MKFIDEAAKLARQGGMYETVNEVYKATLPVAEANRNFEKLAEVHKEISDAFQEIIRLQVKACKEEFRIRFAFETWAEPSWLYP